ncbi:MAG: hypothetical protein DSZ06_00465 [Sulfurospirillum sp.]|nr:MAG: hypothetical protein DSZ06_00465 [Sulfurospirillum sp.]
MVRKQWLWLFVWIFIFFSIFCVWNKSKEFYLRKNRVLNIDKNISNTKALKTKAIEDMHIKILKNPNSLILSGVVINRAVKDEILESYKSIFGEVNASKLLINKNTKDDLFGVDLLTNLAEDFKYFENASLIYSKDLIEINATTSNSVAKASILRKIDILKDQDVKVKQNIILKQATENLKSDDLEQNSTNPKESDENLSKQNITTNLSDSNIDANISAKSNDTNSSNDNNISVNKQIQDKLDSLLKDKKVRFLYASDKLTKKSRKILDQVAKILKENNCTVEIGGHTDSDGTRKRNLNLSKRRAKSVKQYLIKKGISKERLKAIGYADEYPLVKNDSLKNKEINRRVEFKVIGEKK